MKKLLFFLCLSAALISCSGGPKEENNGSQAAASVPDLPGKAIFLEKCRVCHGTDGQLGVSGAANLAISTLTVDEKVQVITNGRRGMASWKDQLTADQIKEVAEYVQTLKQ